MKILINYITIILLLLNQTQYSLSTLAYVFVIANLVYSIVVSRQISSWTHDFTYVGLILIIILSFIANDIPDVFNSHFKFVGFLVVILFCSNIINNSYLALNRAEFLTQVNKVFTVFTGLCLVGLLMGIFPRFNENETAGGFSGIFNSSMFLAPVCALVIIYNFYLSARTKKYRVLRLVILLSNFYLLFLTGSRSALLAVVIALLLFLFKEYSDKLSTLLKRYWYLIVVLIVLLLNLKQVAFFNVYLSKFELEESSGVNSRRSLWDNRIAEFTSNPIFGIGFNSVDLEISSHEFKEESGSIEPGSSWLFLLSTLGLLGVIVYLAILTEFIRKLFSKNQLYQNYILGVITFLIIHMFFEGYIFAVGNIIVFVFYLTLSNLSNIKSEGNDIIRRSLYK